MSPTEAFDVFISYARGDSAHVVPWVKKIRDGGLKVFFDTECIVSGPWREKIAGALQSCRLVIFIASRSSLSSKFVSKELTLADEYRKTILPVFLEDAEVPQNCALILAGEQRINVYAMTADETWEKISLALADAGLTWAPPKPPEPVRRPKRDDRNLDLDVEIPKIFGKETPPKVKATPAQQPRPWALPIRHVLATLAGLALIGIGMGSWRAWGGAEPRKPEPPKLQLTKLEPANVEPVKPLPPPSPAPVIDIPIAIPVAQRVTEPETPVEAAERLTRQYYNSPGEEQLALLSDNVDYLDHEAWTKQKVADDLRDYAQRWPRRSMKIAEPMDINGPNADGDVVCTQQVHFEIGNEVVKNSGNFVGVITVGSEDNEPRIVSVKEVPGSRTDKVLEYLTPGQEQRAIALVKQDVESGNSAADVPPEKIAGWYMTQKVSYYGEIMGRADIVKDIEAYRNRWTSRTFRIQDGPTVTDGLGTESVTLSVTARFETSRLNGAYVSAGTTTLSYEIHFSRDGTPLIKSIRETGHQKAPSGP